MQLAFSSRPQYGFGDKPAARRRCRAGKFGQGCNEIMLHIPILRQGKPYESVEKVELVHHATGEPIASVSQANSGMVVRDIRRMDDAILEQFTVSDLIEMCRKAADHFMNGVLPIGDEKQTFDDYTRCLSATTGMPVAYCRANADKIRRVLAEMDVIIAGLTRGFDLSILDRGFGQTEPRSGVGKTEPRPPGSGEDAATKPRSHEATKGNVETSKQNRAATVRERLSPGVEGSREQGIKHSGGPAEKSKSQNVGTEPRPPGSGVGGTAGHTSSIPRSLDPSIPASTTAGHTSSTSRSLDPSIPASTPPSPLHPSIPRSLDPLIPGAASSLTLSFFREGRIFGAVLPSNSPGVHGLWIPAVALKAPIVLKPGREEPWTPLRIIEALAAAGLPREAFGFYPTDHAGAGELLRNVDRSMLFGDTSTTAPWKDDPRVEIHGPGFSKVILGEDAADDWERYLDVIERSIAANGGRSCINASGVWTPRNGRQIAEALAARLAKVSALPADDPRATIAAFANPAMAERMSALIDHELRVPGAEDVTERIRGRSRLFRAPPFMAGGEVAYLLPTIIRCDDREHPLCNREFLFPFASVVECPTSEMPEAIGRSLVVSAITKDRDFIAALMSSPNVDRLNIGPIPTYQLSWDQPHEGNLFEHLYRQRAFQMDEDSGAILAHA